METLYTIESVIKMPKPADSFFVKLEDNVYGIRFKGFRLRDCDTNQTFHEYYAQDIYELDYFADHLLEYRFPNKILNCKTLGSNLTLVVGDSLVQKLTLIEKHFIEDKLAASYRTNYPLFMPNSENNIEFIYSVPELSEEIKKKISLGETIKAKSDTFIFVDGKLIIHRRACYDYVG
jgi:hypothetical protein